MLSRIAYRFRQFFWARHAGQLDGEEARQALLILGNQPFALFQKQTIAGQRHSYRVMIHLRGEGHVEPVLLQAALLHDVGKSMTRVAWWDWPIVVLAKAIVPSLVSRWAEGDAAGWRRAFVAKAHHAEWGAEAARQAGCSEMVVHLIRRHQERPVADGDSEEERLLRLLVEADEWQ